MTERKVLNKYYPPDYDYRKIPRLRRDRNAQWVQRVMAPFNMRCNTCGHYIYRGTKFNARRETAQGETYLGLKIFRFYIRCPMCCTDISFKTDIENLDYAIETGASRNFEAAKLIAAEDKRKQEEVAAEEANNPMAVLENRTRDSRREMEIMENLEELKERADSNAQTDLNDLIGNSLLKQQQLLARVLLKQEEEDEAFIGSLYEKTSDGTKIKRIAPTEDIDFDIDDCDSLPNLLPCTSGQKRSTDFLAQEEDEVSSSKVAKFDSKPAKTVSKSSLTSLVKVKSKKVTSCSSTSDEKTKEIGVTKDNSVCSTSSITCNLTSSDDKSNVVSSEAVVQVSTSSTHPETAQTTTTTSQSSTTLFSLGNYSDSSGSEIEN